MNDHMHTREQRERVLQTIEQFGLLTRQEAEALLLPSVRIHVGSALADSALPLGASRLGWRPDLPPGVGWPRVEVPEAMRGEPAMLGRSVGNAPRARLGDERALPFLCQISLSEVAPPRPATGAA